MDPDSAVKMMESVAWVLGNAPDEQRHRFLDVLHDLAKSEEHPGRRAQLLAFPFACGLIDDEPPRPAEPWTVPPDRRAGHNVAELVTEVDPTPWSSCARAMQGASGNIPGFSVWLWLGADGSDGQSGVGLGDAQGMAC